MEREKMKTGKGRQNNLMGREGDENGEGKAKYDLDEK